jgi:aryl-alcohol dehydrogenase-like predicted oxidoreductase
MTRTIFNSPPPEAPTALAFYRQLSPNAGVHVSPLQLGAMNVGDKYGALLGDMDKDASFKLLDAYLEAGGNFIDTASN